MTKFDWSILSLHDKVLVDAYTHGRDPDLIIDSEHAGPYIFRWHLVKRNPDFGLYFHVQVSSDPERPLHDHPWDNMSVILAGGYDEIVQMSPPDGGTTVRALRKGDCVCRPAEMAHRLILPDGIPYTITAFSMGRYRRPWGFWIGNKWFSHEQCSWTNEVTKQVFFRYPTTIGDIP